MVGDRPRYELHFHASVRDAVIRDYNNVTQIFQESLTLVPGVPLHQLPADLVDFTGRQDDLERVIALLRSQTSPEQPTNEAEVPRLARVVIRGMAGVGKSALAIRVAHQLKQDFPDAQLYVNLRGTESQPLDPMEVLAAFLRAWGVNEQSMPDDLTQRSKLYRSLLSDKRVLVVLDNVHDEVQVRPLLPTSSSCAVLIATRRHLCALEDTTAFDLGVMNESESLEFLQKLVGEEHVQGGLEAAKNIINFCGRFPLAIRLAGGAIANQPQWRLEECAQRLAHERQQIAQEHLSYQDIRSSFTLSYQKLDANSARLFRLLGLLSGANFAPTIATALLESEPDTARASLKNLVNVQLLEGIGVGRYRLHDLVRLFAKELLAQEEVAEERQAARLRMARWYLKTSEIVNLALKPETRHQLGQNLGDHKNPSSNAVEQNWFLGVLNWFVMERMNLLTSIDWAYQSMEWDVAIALVRSLVNFFNIYAYHTDWERTHLLALEASRKLGELPNGDATASRQGEAQTLINLGNVYALQNDWGKACECYEQSRVIFDEVKDRIEVAKTVGNLANVYSQLGNWEKAKECYQQSLATFVELKDRYGEAQTLANMGILHIKQGQEEEASVLWQQALTKLSPDLPKSERLREWLAFIQKQNSQVSPKPSVKPWTPLELAKNALQWLWKN